MSFSLGSIGGERSASVQASVSVPYPKEFRTVRDNRALLEQIAEKTGGRVLSMSNPAGIDAFLREGLPVPQSARRMWDLMAIIAAALFLCDVAVRRLAIDWSGARKAAADAVARREVGDGSVQAWKKARANASSQRVESNSTQTAQAARDAQSMRDSLSKGPALDVRGELKSGGASNDAKKSSSTTDSDASSDPSGASPAAEETTSRLLRAKRRAGGSQEPDSPDGEDRGR